MRQLSLRVRLALASAAGVLLVTSLAGVIQFQLLRSASMNRVDAELADVSETVMAARGIDGLLDRVTRGQFQQLFPPLLQGISNRRGLAVNQLTYKSGRVVVEVLEGGRIPFNEQELIAVSMLGPEPYYYTTRSADDRLRVFATFRRDGETVYVELIARSIDDIVESEQSFVAFLVAGSILTTIIAGMLGYLITRQAMRPVRRLARAAREIAMTNNLEMRVEQGGEDRDLSNLTATFNEMLDSIEDAYDRIADALAAERRFVTNASHELRTPLTTIHGNVDYLERIGADPRVVADMRASADRLSNLVTDLTELAREEAGVAEHGALVDFDELVRDVVAEPEYDLDTVECETEIDDDVWVRGNEASLASIVRNLVGNAIKYCDGEIRVVVTSNESFAILEVTDNGPGLSAADVEHCFERFWRSEDARSVSGSGLGLAIVASAARSHRGIATAYEGPGGRFKVELPLADPPADVGESGDPGPEGPIGR